MTLSLRAVLALALASACGGGQTGSGVFSTTWDDDNGKAIEEVRQRLARVAIAPGADLALGVAGHSAKLIGQPLGDGARWTFAHALDARPIVAGRVVVASGGGDLFALDALSGKLLWTRPTGGLALHGAGDDGTLTVATLASATGHGSTLLAVSHDGSVLRQIERPVSLGTPAVVDRLAFVPWQNQYVSVLDVTDGSEVGRALLREKTSRAWTVGGGLYFGEAGIFRFDDKIQYGSKSGASYLALPARELPGHPLLMRPGDEATPSVAGAGDKIRLYARPTPPGGALGLDSQRFYATYFRVVLGLSATDARVGWVHTHPSAILGGAAAAGSLVLCDADGKVTALEARKGGQVGEPLDLGEPLESCVVQADGFVAQGATHDPGTVVAQVRTALLDRDAELDAAQTFLLRALVAVSDESATELLLVLAGDPHTTPAAREEARAALAMRRSGAGVLVRALGRHYDFLHDVLTPPAVGPIARALAAMNEQSAAPALASHLLDPADDDRDVRDVALALAVLATPAETPALLRFFALYHTAPAAPEEIPQAVNAVAEALLRVGGKEGKDAIVAASKQAGTNPAVKAKLVALLEADAAGKK